jgi:hypothetical protein
MDLMEILMPVTEIFSLKCAESSFPDTDIEIGKDQTGAF